MAVTCWYPSCSYQQHELAENAKENAGALVLLVTVQKRSRWEVWLFVYKQGEILPETQCNLMGEARVSQWESATWVCLPFCWRIPRILGRNWVVLSSLVRFGGIVSSDAFAVTLFYHWFHLCDKHAVLIRESEAAGFTQLTSLREGTNSEFSWHVSLHLWIYLQGKQKSKITSRDPQQN